MPDAFDKKEYVLSEFKRLIVDKEIRSLILGSRKVRDSLSSVVSYPIYMNNCLTLAYLYAYGCFKKMAEVSECPENNYEDFIPEINNNALRVLNSLDKTYVQYPLTAELMQFVISDLQFDLLPNTESCLKGVFGNVCNFPATARGNYFNLIKYFNLIADWKTSPSRYDRVSNDDFMDMFLELINNLEFLHGHLCRFGDDLAFVETGFYNLATKDEVGIITDGTIDLDRLEEIDDREDIFNYVPMRHTLLKGDGINTFDYYYLITAEKRENTNELDLTYAHTSYGANNLTVRVSTDADPAKDSPELLNLPYDAATRYGEITGVWDESDEQKGNGGYIINQIHAINYKYIKNLALAVSDALSMNLLGKNWLAEIFSKKHPELFSASNQDRSEVDALVIMLMIEESPTSVLEAIFSHREDDRFFCDIITNLDRRFDDSALSFHRKSSRQLLEEVQKIIRKSLLSGDRNGKRELKKESRQIRAGAKALLIISSLIKLVEEDCKHDYIYAGNIYANVENLKTMKDNKDIPFKIECVNEILVDTFKRLVCFYEGVIAYGELKGRYDVESMNVCLPNTRIDEMKNHLATAFLAAATARAQRYKTDARYEENRAWLYIEDFLDLCHKVNSDVVYRDHLYSTVGKYELLDLADFDVCLRSRLGGDRVIDENNVDNWIDFSLIIMEYLKTGSFSDTPIDHNLMNAVYPFAAIYSRGNTNRDGHTTITFTISIDIDNNGKDDYRSEVNVLTEYKYNPYNVFYCLPHVQRSNSRWWIDPLLVSYTDFNKIFES